MVSYIYKSLDAAREEIRLITILPGSRNDDIRISISHVPFHISESDVSSSVCPKLSWSGLQASLPYGWSAGETLEGRAIFHCNGLTDDTSTNNTQEAPPLPYASWDHPDPTFDQMCYETIHPPKQTIHHNPRFEALSYTWGGTQGTHLIHHVDGSTLNIGQNLYNALQDLRMAFQPRVIWIDAISINQNWEEERNQQVKRMRHIYSRASRVIVWLGPESQDSTLAMRTLEYLGQQIEYTKSNFWMPAPFRKEKDWWLPEHRIEYSTEIWDAIVQLVQRPWFGRLWILQEIQLANQEAIIQCGDVEIRWYHLRRAFLKFRRITNGISQFAAGTFAFYRMHHLLDLALNMDDSGFESIITTSLNCQCTEPRDRIYGLVGLLPQAMAKLIEPDYALPVREVYAQTLLQTIQVTNRWMPMCIERAGAGPCVDDLPSWVPHYSDPEMYDAIEAPLAFASSSSAAQITHNPPNELHVTGIPCSDVAELTELIPNDPRAAVQVIRQFWEENLSAGRYPTGEDPHDVYAWTLAMGKLKECWTQADFDPNLADAKTVLDELHHGDTGHMGNCDECLKPWVRRTFQRLSGRRLFRTQSGYIGVCNRHARVGDRVIICLGLYFPMLVRPTPRGTFELTGRCFVHGIMYGEAILGPIPKPWNVTISRTTSLSGVSVLEQRFFNLETGQITHSDPRLGPLPDGWEEVEMEDQVQMGIFLQHYKRKGSGEEEVLVLNSDPRLLPQALMARGVALETFVLT